MLKLSEVYFRIRLQDIDLVDATIYIRAMIRTAARTLTQKPNQVMLLHDYINTVRPSLLKTKTYRLVLTLRGTSESGEGISYLVETFRLLFPNRNTESPYHPPEGDHKPAQRGQGSSGGTGLCRAKISTTERYRQSGLEELQAAIEKHHPLG